MRFVSAVVWNAECHELQRRLHIFWPWKNIYGKNVIHIARSIQTEQKYYYLLCSKEKNKKVLSDAQIEIELNLLLARSPAVAFICLGSTKTQKGK